MPKSKQVSGSVIPVGVLRYAQSVGAATQLDPFEDATIWISSLRSKTYVTDVLRATHGVANKRELGMLATKIAKHSSTALDFIEQAFCGPQVVSFLPLYYAILNLSKITILVSGHRLLLDAQRTHGASYSVDKNCHGLLTDTVNVYPKGAFPLLYRSLTGEAYPFITRHSVRLRDIYPYILNIGHELGHVLDVRIALQELLFELVEEGAGRYHFVAEAVAPARWNKHSKSGQLRYLSPLKGYRKLATRPHCFRSSSVVASSKADAYTRLRNCLDTFLFYSWHARGNDRLGVYAPLSARRLKMPEEVPIWLAFFHLSNVVRYKPDYLDRLKDSNGWPIVLALRKHATYRYMLLFWSHFHQRNFDVSQK